MCGTIVLSPLIRSSLLTLSGPTNNSELIFAAISLFFYGLLAYPISVYLSSYRTSFTCRTDSFLITFNPELLLYIFRPLFAIFNVLVPVITVVLSFLFFLLFAACVLKIPIYAYFNQTLRRAFFSAVAFCGLYTAVTFFLDSTKDSAFSGLTGILCFIPFVELIAHYRLKQLL